MFTKKVKKPRDPEKTANPRGRGRPPGRTHQGAAARLRLYNTAIDFEYHLQGLDVTNERIEITIGITVNEPPLDIAKRFQDRLEHAGIITELTYLGTVGHPD